jgi:hypothetical protein
MARIAVVLAAFSVLAAGLSGPAPGRPACHPIGPHLLATGNLDTDPAAERLAELEGPVDCAHSAFVARVEILDRCAGDMRTYPVSITYRRPDERIDPGVVVEADGLRGRREAFFVVHGATGAEGEAAVVHLVAPRRGACGRPRSLFRYRPRPDVDAFDVQLADRSKRFPGLEVRVTERIGVDRFVRNYRFDRASGRYVPFGSR